VLWRRVLADHAVDRTAVITVVAVDEFAAAGVGWARALRVVVRAVGAAVAHQLLCVVGDAARQR
jgi:hypothetical protein